MTTTTPNLTGEDAVAAALSITDVIAANRIASEQARCLASASIEAMRSAGLLTLLTPRRYGGAEAGIRAQVETSHILAQADPAAGWVQIVLNGHSWIAGAYPEECQNEVFADDPSVGIPGTQAPQGRAEKVKGGWRVSGQWQFCSGADHGTWAMVGAAAHEHPLIHLLLPMEDVEIVDTWYTLGLRGTGSKDIRVDNAFVPDHRSIETRTIFEGLSPYADLHETGLYRGPFFAGLTLQISGVALAIAKRTLALFVDHTRERMDKYVNTAKVDRPDLQLRIAKSTADLTAAELLLDRGCGICDRVSASNAPPTLDDRADLKWHAAYTVELCRGAVSRLFNASGAHTVFDDSELQRLYRDLNTACHHAAVDLDGSGTMFGRTRLGLDPGTPIL